MDREAYLRGVNLFNGGRFFDAHEALEDAWRSADGKERLFLQGLTQAAVGLHHHSTGNLTGACSVLARARRNLTGYPEQHFGIRLGEFRRALGAFESALRGSKPMPEPPRIEAAE